jgi:hypothetical protein
MERCPTCGQSRWIYPRPLAIVRSLKPLTTWRPYECLSCGWRGWLRSGHKDRPIRHGFQDLAYSVVGARLAGARRMVTSISRTLRERFAAGAGRLVVLRPLTVPSLSKWLIPAFAFGLGMGALLFSGEERTDAPRNTPAEDSTVPFQPVTQTSVSAEIPIEALPSSKPPLVSKAVQVPPARPMSRAATAKVWAPPERTRARTDDAVSPAAQRTRASASPAVSSESRYRGALAIDSDPPGAVVSIDGRVVGSTPVRLKEMPAGSCVVRVESSGYELWSAAARVVANKETRVTATLQRGSRP